MNLYQSNARIKRDSLILWVIAAVMLLVFARACYVLIIQAEFLQNEGNKRQIRTLEIAAPRGHILDRNGEVLALSTRIDSIWVDPKVLSFYLDTVQQQTAIQLQKLTPAQIAQQQQNVQEQQAKYQQMLALLDISESNLTPRILSDTHKRFLYVKRNVLPSLSEQIEALDVPGLYVQNEYKRYYPAGEVASHLVGFTDIDDKGIDGVEKAYNDWLTGIAGKKQVVKDRAGRIISFVEDLQPAKAGQDLYLSIDKDIQYFLYHALKKAYIAHQASSIESVILDSKTGEVLAMVSLPSYNPNNRTQLMGEQLKNRVLTDKIEPGSTLKPFIVAKALDEGVLTLDEKIDTSPGSIRIQGQRITDTHNHGELTAGEIIEKSSNVGASKIALRLQPQQEWQLYHDLGFGEYLGLFLPGVTPGYLRPAEQWRPLDQASAAFGYGLDMNLMQLARAYLMLANQGVVQPVSILKISEQQAASQGKQVVSAEAANAVLNMMKAVVLPGGTAPMAKVAGYQVAGKTGTVHLSVDGGYELNNYRSLFAGIIPASAPRYVMAICVTDPSRGIYYGGKVAAPLFKEVMTEVLRLKNIPPDDYLVDK